MHAVVYIGMRHLQGLLAGLLSPCAVPLAVDLPLSRRRRSRAATTLYSACHRPRQEPLDISMGSMDAGSVEEQWSLLTAAMFGLLSFSVVLAMALLVVLACRTRRYALNWFEKNLLETAKAQEMSQSEVSLMRCETDCESRCSSVEGTARTEDDKFWVPPTLLPRSTSSVIPAHAEASSAALATDNVASQAPLATEDSVDSASGPQTPKTPQSVGSGSENGNRPRLPSMQARLDHTKIDTALYQKAGASDSSGKKENVVLGAVHLTLFYDPPAGMLSVRLLEAQNLKARDFSGTADPYAKIRLLPDRNNVWQTRIHKKTLNPIFDEDFVFEVSAQSVSGRTLEVLLYDFDSFSRHQCIGGVELPLASLQLAHKTTLWENLAPHAPRETKAEAGDLMISLSFLPSAERLTIVVLKARNLRIVDDTRSTSDPYVRILLMSNEGGRRSRKKRTSTQRGTVNPVYNEALTFDVSREALSNSTLEFCVLSDDEVLGVTRLGSSSSGGELAFFREMLASRSPTARWLTLNEPD